MTIYSLDVLFFLFGSLLFHVQFLPLLPGLHTDFSRGRSGGLDPDNHDGVITHTDIEPDMLECKVQWALGNITMSKASEGDGIPVELFQILKDEAVKVLHSICQ